MENNYDSAKDTYAHKKNVEKVMGVIIKELEKRAIEHDDSKLKSPEKEVYDKWVPILRELKYGTPEYNEARKTMQKDGLQHHFEENRHHPEHYPNNDISQMTIVDLVEMFVDHYASSLRSDTGYEKGESLNRPKYHYSDQIFQIMMNTYNEYFK